MTGEAVIEAGDVTTGAAPGIDVSVDDALASFMAMAASPGAPAEIDEELPWDLKKDPVVWEDFAKKEPKLSRSADDLEKAMEEKTPPPAQRGTFVLETVKYDHAEVKRAKTRLRKVHYETMTETRQTLGSLLMRDYTRVMGLRGQVRSLIDEGLARREVFGAIASTESHDDYLVSHSMTSALYSSLVGQALGFSREELYDLAEAALLHDIGMRWIPPGLVNKPARLTDDEQLQIQKHTIFGADVLSEADGVTMAARYAAYQHHERFDGSGYPKGKKGDRIHEFARIVGMVDVYTAMTSPRAHRRKMNGYDAMKHILSLSGAHFDPSVVKAFLASLSLYPVGSIVRLTDQSIGIVVAAHPKFVYRPQVKIKRAPTGEDFGAEGVIIDLSENRTMNIDTALPDSVLGSEEIWKAF